MNVAINAQSVSAYSLAIVTMGLSCTVSEVVAVTGLTFKSHPRSNVKIVLEARYMSSYLSVIVTVGLSRSVREQ